METRGGKYGRFLAALVNDYIDKFSPENESGYREDLAGLVAAVKERGLPLDPAEIVESDIIVPPEDLTLEEARKAFSGSGLIED